MIRDFNTKGNKYMMKVAFQVSGESTGYSVNGIGRAE